MTIKKTGGISVCVDCSKANEAVVIDIHPLPHILAVEELVVFRTLLYSI